MKRKINPFKLLKELIYRRKLIKNRGTGYKFYVTDELKNKHVD